MRFRGAHVTAVCGGDKDCTTGVSSLANEEPLVVVKLCVDTVWKVVGEDGGDSRYSVVREGETSLRRSRCGTIRQRTSGTEDGYISRGWSVGGHRGSEVFASGRGDEDVVGVDGNVLVERGKKEGVEDLLSYLGGSGRHGRRMRVIETTLLIRLVVRVSVEALSGDCHRSLQSGLERTSPTLEPKSLLTGGTLSIVRGTGDFDVFHGSET